MNNRDRETAFKLLEQNSSIADVTRYLREKGVSPYSAGSWKHLIEERIEPALKSGQITRSDILRLMAEAEEFGRQHVFLYNIAQHQGIQFTNTNYIRKALSTIDREDLFDTPAILDLPARLTLSEFRVEDIPKGRCTVIKAVQAHEHRQFLGEEKEGKYIYRKYEYTVERAVNVARFFSDGLTEVRIFSHRGAADYQSVLNDFWDSINFFAERIKFNEFSVMRAKRNLWEQMKKDSASLKFKDAKIYNPKGNSLTAATGSMQASLIEDESAAASVDLFWSTDAVCEDSLVSWPKGAGCKVEPLIPSKEINVRIAGAVNEFTVTSSCLRGDYEFVLEKIREAAKK